MSLRVITWNVEWATPSSPRASEILRRLGRHAPEVVCLTETHVRLPPQDGHTICSQPDYGYTIKEVAIYGIVVASPVQVEHTSLGFRSLQAIREIIIP